MSPGGRVELLRPIDWHAKAAGAIDPGARQIVIGLLGDASASVREQAFRVLEHVSIQPQEAQAIEPLLSRKASDLPRGLIRLLLNQTEPARSVTVQRLTRSNTALIRPACLYMH